MKHIRKENNKELPPPFWSSLSPYQVIFFEHQPPVYAQTVTCAGNFQSVAIPLTELGNSEYIRMDGNNTGFSGGLYPNGENRRPVNHEQAGLALAESI